MPNRVYLDHNATTKIRPEVIQAVTDVMVTVGNASSVHAAGKKARQTVELARKQVSMLVNATPNQVVFTSGGTEADNQAMRNCDPKKTLVSAIEHPAILDSCPGANQIPVTEQGVVDLDALDRMLYEIDSPQMVAIMLANNETGVLQPIREATKIAHSHGALLHCDAVQAVGKIPVDFDSLGMDTMALTAHKFGGPQGIGALVTRDSDTVDCMIQGGGQERGLRGGTESVAQIAALGVASHIAGERMETYTQLSRLRDMMENRLKEVAGGLTVFGIDADRLPNTSKIMMPGVSSETQVIALDLAGVEVSAGSACSAGRIEPPYVLTAMGVDDKDALCALRISLGWNTTKGDIELLISEWTKIFKRAANRYNAPAHKKCPI